MNELFIYHLIHSCGFNYQYYDEPKSMSPVEASLLSPRPICIHLAVEHHHWDSSQASQTQNTKNRIIFSPPPLNPPPPPPVFTTSVNGVDPIYLQARNLRVILDSLCSHPYPVHHLPHLLLHPHFIPGPSIVQPPLTSVLSYMLLPQSSSLNPRSNIYPKYHLLPRIPPVVSSAYRPLSH